MAGTQHGARYSTAWDYLAIPGLYYDPTDKLFVVPGGRTGRSSSFSAAYRGSKRYKSDHIYTHNVGFSSQRGSHLAFHPPWFRSHKDGVIFVFSGCLFLFPHSLSLPLSLSTFLSVIVGRKESRLGTAEPGHFYRGYEDHEQRPERGLESRCRPDIYQTGPGTDVRRISDLRPTRPKREPPLTRSLLSPSRFFFRPLASNLRGRLGSTIVNVPTDRSMRLTV